MEPARRPGRKPEEIAVKSRFTRKGAGEVQTRRKFRACSERPARKKALSVLKEVEA
jgi:hypothetical protein